MKKLMILLMCGVLLVGCGSGGADATSETIPTLKKPGTRETQVEGSNLYETEELITKTIGDIEYKVPESWEKGYEESEDGECYSCDNAFIWVWKKEDSIMGPKYSELSEQDKSIELQQCELDAKGDLLKLKMGKATWDSYETIDEKESKLFDAETYESTSNMSRDGKQYFIHSVAIGSFDTRYVFVLLVNQDNKDEFEMDFSSLINSISINASAKQVQSDTFEKYKNNINESSMQLGRDDDMYALIVKGFEDNFFFVKGMTSWDDTNKNEQDKDRFTKFVVSISYYDTHFDEGTVGKGIGESGWNAIKSLMIGDGEFEKNMETLKKTYELSPSNHLFETKYEAGQYKVGTDIPIGEYVFFAEGNSGYFGLTSDANGNDIIANGNFNYNSIITIRDGEYLQLSRCYAVPIEDVSILRFDSANMFKVGTHILEGEYKLVTDGDKGYYCIYGDDRQDDIISNDNFSGQAYVNVSDNQYLLLSGCHIEIGQ